jgi:hypothetical protein
VVEQRSDVLDLVGSNNYWNIQIADKASESIALVWIESGRGLVQQQPSW